MKSETAILIWLPPGDVTQESSFTATGATTFVSLADAVTAADKSLNPPMQPWIATADAILAPEQIRVMTETSTEDD